MSEITLEKVDKVIERTNVSYAEAKKALELNNGDVLESIIYIESSKNQNNFEENTQEQESNFSNKYETIEEFKVWLNDLIKQGNIQRIKIKRENRVLIDIPVNAGIAAGVIITLLSPFLAVGVVATAVIVDFTIEITKEDGSVEVINKAVKETASDLKSKAVNVAYDVKDKFSGIKKDMKFNSKQSNKVPKEEETTYSYTVKFDDENEN